MSSLHSLLCTKTLHQRKVPSQQQRLPICQIVEIAELKKWGEVVTKKWGKVVTAFALKDVCARMNRDYILPRRALGGGNLFIGLYFIFVLYIFFDEFKFLCDFCLIIIIENAIITTRSSDNKQFAKSPVNSSLTNRV